MPEDILSLPGILVEPDWLRERLGHPRLRSVDLREPESWAEAHVPGSGQLDLSKLGSNREVCDNVLLGPDEFAGVMSEVGISNGDVVVAYDDQWGLAAARLVWALHHYGHPAAAVLNGGWDRWLDEGGAVVNGPEGVTPGEFRSHPGEEVSADLGRVAAVANGAPGVLLDTRTRTEFESGHLPGAIPWDWFNAVPEGSWECSRDPAELSAEWSDLGVHPSDEVIVYCRSGMRAAHTYVVLRHAGYPRVRLYDGSWQEWSSRRGGE